MLLSTQTPPQGLPFTHTLPFLTSPDISRGLPYSPTPPPPPPSPRPPAQDPPLPMRLSLAGFARPAIRLDWWAEWEAAGPGLGRPSLARVGAAATGCRDLRKARSAPPTPSHAPTSPLPRTHRPPLTSSSPPPTLPKISLATDGLLRRNGRRDARDRLNKWREVDVEGKKEEEEVSTMVREAFPSSAQSLGGRGGRACPPGHHSSATHVILHRKWIALHEYPPKCTRTRKISWTYCHK